MQAILRASMESVRSPSAERPRTAMDCITNTHDTTLHRTKGPNRKRRLSSTTRTHKDRTVENSPIQPQKQSLQGLGIGFAETIWDSFRRDAYPGHVQQVGIIQTRRKGYRDPRNFYPLQINVPTDSSLTDITNRFENPRKAPHPQGPKYNTHLSDYSTPSEITDLNIPEFDNLAQASVFSLPKFDPEKELRILQDLRSKQSSLGSPSISSPNPPVFTQFQEQSFFEYDSDSEDESPKRPRWRRQSERRASISETNSRY